MTCYIVTESDADAVLFRWLLRPEITHHGDQIQVKDGVDRSGAESYAKGMALVRHEPAALVVNVHSTDVRVMKERKSFLDWYFGKSFPGYEYQILFFFPTAEVVLFRDEALLQDVFGRPLTDVERARAEYDPKRVLAELAAEKQLGTDEVWRRITAHSPDVVRTAPPVPELIEFVHRVLRPEAALVPA